jgi:hypothetical protein
MKMRPKTKRNLGVKDAAKGCLTPEEPNKSRVIVKKTFNFSCLNDHSETSVKVEVLPSDQRWSHQCSRILPSEALTTVKGLILGSQVDLWAEVLERYSSSEDSVGSVLRKFSAQAKGGIGSNIDSDSDRHCWGKTRCVAIGSW